MLRHNPDLYKTSFQVHEGISLEFLLSVVSEAAGVHTRSLCAWTACVIADSVVLWFELQLCWVGFLVVPWA